MNLGRLGATGIHRVDDTRTKTSERSVPEPKTKIRNGLSFDVEESFQVQNYAALIPRESWESRPSRVVANTGRILDLLADNGTRATFFVLGWVAEREPDLIRRILDRGHEVGSHGHDHRRVGELGPEGFREDLERSLEALYRAGAQRVRGFRAPSFSIVESTLWALDILADCGLDYDSSIFPTGIHPTYGIRSAPLEPYRVRGDLWEIPLTVVELAGRRLPVGGGAYFRLLPYAATRWAIRRSNERGRPAIVYLHPWELDPDQPRIAASPWRRLRQMVNVGRTAPRLRRLTRQFDFMPLGEIIDEYEH